MKSKEQYSLKHAVFRCICEDICPIWHCYCGTACEWAMSRVSKVPRRMRLVTNDSICFISADLFVCSALMFMSRVVARMCLHNSKLRHESFA